MLSRIAKIPLDVPSGVTVTINGATVSIKGPLGVLTYTFNEVAQVSFDAKTLQISISVTEDTQFAKALSGTVRALLKNMIIGVTSGFEKKLTIIGVGYRASVSGSTLNLALGYSHPTLYNAPQGISLLVPSQTEVVVKGINKELVGQVAANIRSLRPVEPYKGKGVRYADEEVILKETKKK